MYAVKLTSCLALLAFALPAAATAQQVPDSLPEGVTAEMIQEGAGLFTGAGLCAACHGPDASGAVGPNLTDDEWLLGEGTFEQILQQVLEGVAADQAKTGVPMPPKGGSAITDEQARAVAAYVWSLRPTS